MEGQMMSHFVRGMIVTSAIGLVLVGLSPSTTQAAPYRGHRGYYHGYWGGYRPYVGIGVYGGGYGYGYPGYYGYGYPGYAGYGYPGYGYGSSAYYGGYPGYYGGYYGGPSVSLGWGYGGGYWGGRGYYGHWRR
jgi:hypothetical protein